MTPSPRLTEFQLEVTRTFFELPSSGGFLLGGGAGLLAAGLTDRPTHDLDFFRSTKSVTAARDEFESAVTARGWTVRRLRDHEDFVRLQVTASETLLVDLCLDSPPVRAATMTIAGPTFDPDELAGRKVVALFGRAEARDFSDVQALLAHYGKDELLALAREVDEGFETVVFAEMLRSVSRHPDEALTSGGATAAEVRGTFITWADELQKPTAEGS